MKQKKTEVISLRRISAAVKMFSEKIYSDHITLYAAQSSFFTMIATIPFLMLLITLIRIVFPDAIDSEQGGTRPVLIISNDIGNKHSPTVIIAPITSRIHTKAKLPTHTLIKDFDGLDKNSIILFEQIRAIDKQRLREYLGTLDRRFIHCADKALAISIGLAKKD